jgi:WD40 repeat protein
VSYSFLFLFFLCYLTFFLLLSPRFSSFRFSPDGKWVASASKDGQILFYDLIASKYINNIRIPPAYFTSFEFNPTDFSLAGITSSRSIKFYDLETMKLSFSTTPESQIAKSITYNNLGNQLFIASKQFLKIYDIENSLSLIENIEVGWNDTSVGDMKIFNNDQMIAVSYNLNFVTVYEVDLTAYLGGGGDHTQGHNDGGDDDDYPHDFADGSYDSQDYHRRNSRDSYDENNNNINNDKEKEKGIRRKSFDSEQPNVPTTGKAMKPPPVVQAKETSVAANRPYDSNVARKMVSDLNVDVIAPPKASGSFRSPVSRKDIQGDVKPAAVTAAEENEGTEMKGYYDDEKHQPEVVTEEGYKISDMATSMGESFWNKFKGSLKEQQQLPGSSSSSAAVDEEDMNKAVNAIESLLPPSAFGNDYDNDRVAHLKSQQQPSSQRNHSSPGIAAHDKPPVRVMNRKDNKASPASFNEIESKQSSNNDVLSVVGSRHVPSSSSSSARPTTASSDPNSLIDKLLDSHHTTASQLRQRLSILQELRHNWIMGNEIDTIKQLKIIGELKNNYDIFILTDFFSALSFEHQKLNLDSCVTILPIIENMLNTASSHKTSSEYIVIVVYKALIELASLFGELIRSTRSIISIGGISGVDISREERLRKCNICYDAFKRAKQRVEVYSYQFKQNTEIKDLLHDYNKLYHQFF